MIGIGIDTGGTYTDAVIYNLKTKKILASGKSLTTRYDLKIGIKNVLEKLPFDLLRQCESLALSTTLATNACVENKGGRGKLILIGSNGDVLENTHKNYGIDTLDDVYVLECKLTDRKDLCDQPDWSQFEKSLPSIVGNYDCVSVVQLFAVEHLGSYEKRAREIIERNYDMSVIIGHDLFPDRNVLRRGAGALLNARLIPLINEFLDAVQIVFSYYGLDIPITIVNSSGNLMSREYTCSYPVETLLCGPAASILGAQYLSEEKEAIVVDMGGTTTDVAIIKGGEPLGTGEGIHIGSWKTFVKGLYVDTFALGGDTAVHYDGDRNLFLEEERVIPLCVLAKHYPSVTKDLAELNLYENGSFSFHHEFFVLMKYPEDPTKYTTNELDLCGALKEKPLILLEAAKASGSRYVHFLKTERLEKDEIIMKAGLTPTDIMHIKGDFNEFDVEASKIAADFVAKFLRIRRNDLCSEVYGLVTKRLYDNLVRILIQNEYHAFSQVIPEGQLQELIDHAYSHKSSGLLETTFKTNSKLISIGAPTHIFLKPVADLLETQIVQPKYASVANAIGAIVGNVVSSVDAEIRPIHKKGEKTEYRVYTKEAVQVFPNYKVAYKFAKEEVEQLSIQHAIEQGAEEPIDVSFKTKRDEIVVGVKKKQFLSERITAIASGKISGS